MGLRLEDGKGRGRYAAVDHDNRLEVAAITLPLLAERSHEGDAFSLVGEHTIQVSDTEENVAFVTNGNSNKHVHLTSVTLAAETATVLTIVMKFGATYTSGGTSVTPVQLNRGSAKASGVELYDNSANNLVVGATNADTFVVTKFGMASSGQLQGSDAVILGPGDTLLVTATGTAGNKVAITSFIYETTNVDE